MQNELEIGRKCLNNLERLCAPFEEETEEKEEEEAWS